MPKNDAEALSWFRKAAVQGYTASQNSIGYCYETGRGVRMSIAEAIEWYEKAAAQGNQKAKEGLARLRG